MLARSAYRSGMVHSRACRQKIGVLPCSNPSKAPLNSLCTTRRSNSNAMGSGSISRQHALQRTAPPVTAFLRKLKRREGRSTGRKTLWPLRPDKGGVYERDVGGMQRQCKEWRKSVNERRPRERESGDPKERYISDTAGGWNETMCEERGERGAVAERVDREKDSSKWRFRDPRHPSRTGRRA